MHFLKVHYILNGNCVRSVYLHVLLTTVNKYNTKKKKKKFHVIANDPCGAPFYVTVFRLARIFPSSDISGGSTDTATISIFFQFLFLF